ncbi:hypothetical protein PIB30_034651 [Stylosanthes scabra]|uniref:Uncharacterized protein n=1 Tax=Stylosanthes scabra TaxID=79078 RepID=A0ABU6ZCN9_9FABA|nr:hypothetical protein [Stylosanthes scabra]
MVFIPSSQLKLKNGLIPLATKLEEDNFSTWKKLVLLTIRTLKLDVHLDPAKTPPQFEEIVSLEVKVTKSASGDSTYTYGDSIPKAKKTLPALQHLELSNVHELKKIDFEIHNKNNASAFKSLETLKFENLPCWRQWHFLDEFDGLPQLRILSIRKCHVLRGDLPAHLPTLEKLTIVECEKLTCSLSKTPKLH